MKQAQSIPIDLQSISQLVKDSDKKCQAGMCEKYRNKGVESAKVRR